MRTVLIILAAFIVTVSCKPSQTADVSTTKQVIIENQDSTESVAHTDENVYSQAVGRIISEERSLANKTSCTIFNTEKGVLTAGHCVFWGQPEKLNVNNIQLDWKGEGFESLQKVSLDSSSIIYKLENSIDFAWIRTDGPDPSASKQFTLAKIDSKIPEELIVLGFPLNKTKSECNSMFAEFRHKAFECATRDLVQTTCSDIKLTEGGFSAKCDKPIASGFSGSPAFAMTESSDSEESLQAEVWGILNSTDGELVYFTGVQNFRTP
ncbi:trypsin-like serine protease [Oligoflexaceae bacterium]|nr:trypsin-like serine protease [Oligoflexaceae bacterium]